MLDGLTDLRDGKVSLAEVIGAYETEMVPRGQEEVKCSVENGLLLHDWAKIQQSPVFQRGFKPMDGHDKPENKTSEHAKIHMGRTAAVTSS